MNKVCWKIFPVLFSICCIIGGCTPKKLVQRHCAPNEEYCLEIYKEKIFWAMPGQGSDHMATIHLLDGHGRMINSVTGNSLPDESILLRDIEIRWDLEDNKIWYGRARYFEVGRE